MVRPSSRYPTELELEILKIIWRDGPSSGRQVCEALAGYRQLAYTSVMTIMNIMMDKGYLRREKQDGSYVYHARTTEKATRRRMLRDLVDRVFDGSATTVMVNLLENGDIGSQELNELRRLINRKAKEEES